MLLDADAEEGLIVVLGSCLLRLGVLSFILSSWGPGAVGIRFIHYSFAVSLQSVLMSSAYSYMYPIFLLFLIPT